MAAKRSNPIPVSICCFGSFSSEPSGCLYISHCHSETIVIKVQSFKSVQLTVRPVEINVLIDALKS